MPPIHTEAPAWAGYAAGVALASCCRGRKRHFSTLFRKAGLAAKVGEFVAQDRGAFELKRLRGLEHLGLDLPHGGMDVVGEPDSATIAPSTSPPKSWRRSTGRSDPYLCVYPPQKMNSTFRVSLNILTFAAKEARSTKSDGPSWGGSGKVTVKNKGPSSSTVRGAFRSYP